ncbi:hypothetical protein ACWEPH_32015 [Nocardia beijingensis]|uniref:hypothetical protein n=1 Tax=Nocardia beijingensis TaxID=95162 RepID=UPI001895B054|nr:hypothetical protein [Nocardia beijingensis]MBF6079579.1 hypothetical protein [Nocardia beijingensis]
MTDLAAYRAEYAARSVERARRFYRAQPGIVHAHTPGLPDDAEFYAALESGLAYRATATNPEAATGSRR